MIADISLSTTFRNICICKAGSFPEQNSANQEESGVESDEKSDDKDSHMEDNSPDHPDNDMSTRLTLSVGQWVLVRYDGLEFPGDITSCGHAQKW